MSNLAEIADYMRKSCDWSDEEVAMVEKAKIEYAALRAELDAERAKSAALEADKERWRKAAQAEPLGLRAAFHGAMKRAETAEAQRDDAIDLLYNMTFQACAGDEGIWDSHAISDFAEAMRYLAGRGLIEITKEHRRRVFATVPKRAAPVAGDAASKGDFTLSDVNSPEFAELLSQVTRYEEHEPPVVGRDTGDEAPPILPRYTDSKGDRDFNSMDDFIKSLDEKPDAGDESEAETHYP